MSLTRFEISRKGPVLYGAFVRDRGPNAFTEELLEQIDAFSAQIEAEPEIRAGIITGSGKAFCLGTDLIQLQRGFADPHVFRRYLVAFNRTMNRIEALPVPIVCAINGMARAGGLEIVLASDLAVIAEDALIGDAHSAQSAIPAGGSTQRLPRRVGTARAKELTWSGRFMPATEAVDWGLCYKAVPSADLMAATEALVATFTDKPRACLYEIKQLISRSDSIPLLDGIDLEIASFLLYVQNHPYVRDGFDAFQASRAKAPA